MGEQVFREMFEAKPSFDHSCDPRVYNLLAIGSEAERVDAHIPHTLLD